MTSNRQLPLWKKIGQKFISSRKILASLKLAMYDGIEDMFFLSRSLPKGLDSETINRMWQVAYGRAFMVKIENLFKVTLNGNPTDGLKNSRKIIKKSKSYCELENFFEIH